MLLVLGILLAVFVLESPWGLVAIALGGAIELAQLGFWLWYTRRKPIRMGVETLVGARAVVVTPCLPDGQVRVQGELWQARCAEGAVAGEAVLVRRVEGLVLEVERA